jgi:hypothetical protein
MITHIGSVDPMTMYQKQGPDRSVKKTSPDPKEAPVQDTLSLNRSSAAPGTYAPNSTDNLRQMIVNLFKEQGLSARIATDDTTINFQNLTPEQAQDLIAEDGYFGVAQTSDRIVTAAVALAGSDPAKLDQIKAGIDKGFDMAAQALGGSLPDISSQTYDAVMEKLDAWAQGSVVA